MGRRIAAFFDLDCTLLTVNSGALWIKRERRLGRLTRKEYLEGLFYLLAYRMNMIDMEQAMGRALLTIKGEREEVVRQWTRDWYYDEVAGRVAPGARRALFAHRRAGHRLVLLSTTSPYQAEVVAEHLSLDGCIHSGYEVREGVFTGSFVQPLCYAEGKVVLAERYGTTAVLTLDRRHFDVLRPLDGGRFTLLGGEESD